MALTISDVITPATAAQWLAQFLANASTVGLPASTWQSGAIARTIIALLSNMQAGEDVLVSLAAQGGFLDFAGSGTVVYTNGQGQQVTAYVTPDPSIPAQWPVPGVQPPPGWLDFLADSTYNCQRIQATSASGTLTFANTGAASSPTYPQGTYHVANPTSGATYSNASSLTIAASSILGGGVTNVTNVGGAFQITTSGAHGLTSGNVVYIANVGGTTGANGFWVVTVIGGTTFTLNGSTFSGVYTSGGTVYSTQQAAFVADAVGAASTSGIGLISQPVTAVLGVVVTNLGSLIGSNVESNAALVLRCRLKIQSLSPNGPAGAYAFVALTAFQTYANASVSGSVIADALTTPITQALVTVNTTTGSVTTYVSNANAPGSGLPVVQGVTNLAVTAATNASPIQITVGSTTGLANGMRVSITGVQGNTAANGLWTIAGVTGTTFTLTGSTGNGTYTTGGVVEAGDLGLVDTLIQASVVPLGITATTTSALQQSIATVVNIWVPATRASQATADVTNAVSSYFSSVPIGGFVTGVPTPNTLPLDGVVEAIVLTATYARDVTVTLIGGTADVAITAGSVPVATPLTINVNTF